MKIGIVIAAAGASVRMGRPKQLLPYGASTLLQHTIELALSRPGATVVLVLGAQAAQIRSQVDASQVHVVENSAWSEGLGGSLRAGLQALLALDPAVEAVLFLVCDQPRVSPDLVHDLCSAFERSGLPIAASEYAGELGVPALFARSMFPELLALRGGEGAKPIIQRHRAQAIGIPFADGAVDVDTPADYERLLRPRAAMRIRTPERMS